MTATSTRAFASQQDNRLITITVKLLRLKTNADLIRVLYFFETKNFETQLTF